FTNKRLILVDKQGLTGNKVEYHSVPYKSIIQFSIETAGAFDRDSELKLYITGGQVIEKELKRSIDIRGLQKTLASYILK
ncbi:MAG: helicase, partial [Phototrophicales bacterium]